MEKNFARIISYIFHPLLIPTYFVLILIILPESLNFTMPFRSSMILMAFIFLSTFIFPVLLILILKNFNLISSLEMANRRERVLPLIMMSLIFYTVFYLLKQGPFNTVFNLFMLGSTMLLLISLLINYFWKISLHMVAQGGLFGTLLGFSLRFGIEIRVLLILSILIAGIIGFARLKLKSHAPPEIYSGFILGAALMMGLFLMA
jgi:hypothetical protein